jgi:hypothetical protein
MNELNEILTCIKNADMEGVKTVTVEVSDLQLLRVAYLDSIKALEKSSKEINRLLSMNLKHTLETPIRLRAYA